MTDRTVGVEIRRICLGLPEATERLSHGAPTYFVRNKAFVYAWLDGHHATTFPQLWCAAPAGVQAEVVRTEPRRFFSPPYVGTRGWLGVRLDVDLDWTEVEAICTEAYRTVAPHRLLAQLDD